MSNQEELIDIWKFNTSENEYISINDDKCFKRNDVLKLSYFYRTHVLPLPFIGEVEKPDILILALNPSYDPINDEADTIEVDKENYISNLFDVNFFSNIEDSKKIIGENTFKWWKNNVFKNIANIKEDISIGIFNLCGYHTRQYETIPKELLDSISYLPTQGKTINIVKYLINNNIVKLVFIVWGKNEWKKCLNLELDDRFIIINGYNNRNKSIFDYYKKETSTTIRKKLEDCFEFSNN